MSDNAVNFVDQLIRAVGLRPKIASETVKRLPVSSVVTLAAKNDADANCGEWIEAYLSLDAQETSVTCNKFARKSGEYSRQTCFNSGGHIPLASQQQQQLPFASLENLDQHFPEEQFPFAYHQQHQFPFAPQQQQQFPFASLENLDQHFPEEQFPFAYHQQQPQQQQQFPFASLENLDQHFPEEQFPFASQPHQQHSFGEQSPIVPSSFVEREDDPPLVQQQHMSVSQTPQYSEEIVQTNAEDGTYLLSDLLQTENVIQEQDSSLIRLLDAESQPPNVTCILCAKSAKCRTFHFRSVRVKACAECVNTHHITICKPPVCRDQVLPYGAAMIAIPARDGRLTTPTVFIESGPLLSVIDYCGPCRTWKRIRIKLHGEWSTIEKFPVKDVVIGNKTK